MVLNVAAPETVNVPVPSTMPPVCSNEAMEALTALKLMTPASTSSKLPKLAEVVIPSVAPESSTIKMSLPTVRLATLTEGEAPS